MGLKLLEWIKWLFSPSDADNNDEPTESAESLRAAFKARYHHFRLLLAANNKALEYMAAMEEARKGLAPFGMSFVRNQVTGVAAQVFQIIRQLNELAPDKYPNLMARFKEIQAQITPYTSPEAIHAEGPLTIPFREMNASHAPLTGSKMATLGEARTALGLRTPHGFVITAAAYYRFIEHNELEPEIQRCIQTCEKDSADSMVRLSTQLRQLIMSTEVPPDLAEEMMQRYHALVSQSSHHHVAMRSSALGEDSADASFAGQYQSILNVGPDSLLDAYKEVVASKYGVPGMTYRMNRGILDRDVAMCVGCMHMIQAVSGGVAYSASPVDAVDNAVLVNSVWGLPKAVVDGSVDTDQFVVDRQASASGELYILDRRVVRKDKQFCCFPEEGLCREVVTEDKVNQPSLDDDQIRQVARLALTLEHHFKSAQDIEWAFGPSGNLYLLQCRPLLRRSRSFEEVAPSRPILLEKGITASPGAACGPVRMVRKSMDQLTFPKGAVLVTDQATPKLASLLDRAAALLCERGCITGHLASVAREFGVPAVFGLGDALSTLRLDQEVTVDADAARVLDGCDENIIAAASRPKPHLMQGSPVHTALEGAMEHITPLNLLNPESADFRPMHCQTLHDITRFCHEKSVLEMFSVGRNCRFPKHSARQLFVENPMQFWIINLDDGFTPEEDEKKDGLVRLFNITSLPMLSLWDGMVAIPWDGPPAINARGFMSVLLESTINPHLEPAAGSSFTSRNYFMISRNFCSLQSRFGYHFCSVESLIGERPTENYATFRFQGGAADFDRRRRRVEFVASILEDLGFATILREDNALARLEGFEQAYMLQRLKVLGYLITHTRQLDMIMKDSTSVANYRNKMDKDIQGLLAAEEEKKEVN
ncbi:MAG: PEP/pyruvate-binding domain-containing protein [Desulfovibrio sp.]|uniref:PEP/pyruvate-binding domain-containing protein n=1 Tax=Desulfovibrio sp. 7SRBS1 TaxID=3378064 RepID=UPI003B3EFB55